MNYSEQFAKTAFPGPYPEAHTIAGQKVPPDGPAQPPSNRMMWASNQPMPVGLSYPGTQDLGPYRQHCGEGLPPSFVLDFGNSIPFSCGSVHSHTALMLFTYVLNQRPLAVVETGTFHGYSTFFMAEALRLLGDGGKVYTIDPEPKLIPPSVANHPNVELVKGYGDKVLPGLLADLGEVQFAFLDSWKRMAYAEFCIVHPYLPAGGMAVFHDTQFLNTGYALYRNFSIRGTGDGWEEKKISCHPDYDVMLFAGTPHRENPHRYFGNCDDRGLLVLRKREADPFLHVRDMNSAEMHDRMVAPPDGVDLV